MIENFTSNRVIIFDGICSLCNSSVSFLKKRLNNNEYKFIASKTEMGKEYIEHFQLGGIPYDSVILIKDKVILEKSDVFFEILKDLPFQWKVFNLLKILPKNLRNWGYDFIAANRYLWFGKVNK